MISTSLLDSRGRRTRTLDIWFWRPTFYQLNYAPIYFQNFTQILIPLTLTSGFRLMFLGQALDRLVTVSSMRCRTSTSALSTWYSLRGLTSSGEGISHLGGGFTLRCLQRLSLPDLATLPWDWFPTGTPVVRPARSSRTKASSPQISSARAG